MRRCLEINRENQRELQDNCKTTARPTLHIEGGAPSAIFYVVNATSESERHVEGFEVVNFRQRDLSEARDFIN
jgi:hypothetical protein